MQLEAVLDAGVTVDAYVYLYWRRDVRAEVARALETIEGLRVGRLWLDCEDDSSGIEPGVIVERIDTAIEACALIPAGIYTGRWWWAPATLDSSDSVTCLSGTLSTRARPTRGRRSTPSRHTAAGPGR